MCLRIPIGYSVKDLQRVNEQQFRTWFLGSRV